MRRNDILLCSAVIAAIMLLFIACSKDKEDDVTNWKVIETSVFKVDVPEDWQFIDLHGIDTYNGLLTNYRDSLNFDYGINLDTFVVDSVHWRVSYETIHGKRAKILEGKASPQMYGLVMDSARINLVNPDSAQYTVRRFIMMQSSYGQMDRGTALKIFRSVRFH